MPKATASAREFNHLGGNIPKPDPPSCSWWTLPELQNNRPAFQQRLVTEELRMLGGKFGGRKQTHNKFKDDK